MKSMTLGVVALVSVFASSAFGQVMGAEAMKGTITGQGTAVIEKKPQTLRLQVELQAKGKDLKGALAKLKARRSAASEQLVKMGASKESIVLGPTKLNAETNQQRQLEAMVRAKLKKGKGAATQPAAPVKVSCTFKAEWNLDAQDSEATLVRVHDIQEQIKSADLAGQKATEELSPEEQEMMEESDGVQQFNYGGGGEQNAGEPVFLYVSKITPEEQAKARADAFAKAKAQATQLAQAAAVKIGPLYSLYGASVPDYSPFNNYDGTYNTNAYRFIQQQAQTASGDDDTEALGADPDKIVHRVTVNASFAIGQ